MRPACAVVALTLVFLFFALALLYALALGFLSGLPMPVEVKKEAVDALLLSFALLGVAVVGAVVWHAVECHGCD